ncbi:hypothetical protein NDU88_004918 [Pleurodeles waltl]|uniref:Secreted protein n=1 Tax=Pleurodeles waltl TaxID=8319 RepID=A0AAV7MFE0_PLEWA|nr:hypothetical protein NDU88_004918 [Pleurodeles waltl]
MALAGGAFSARCAVCGLFWGPPRGCGGVAVPLGLCSLAFLRGPQALSVAQGAASCYCALRAVWPEEIARVAGFFTAAS